MPPDSGGICLGVDSRNHLFAPGLPPGWEVMRGRGEDRRPLDAVLFTELLEFGGHPGDNIRANGTSRKSASLRMLPELGVIPRKLTKYLPPTRLQGGGEDRCPLDAVLFTELLEFRGSV